MQVERNNSQNQLRQPMNNEIFFDNQLETQRYQNPGPQPQFETPNTSSRRRQRTAHKLDN